MSDAAQFRLHFCVKQINYGVAIGVFLFGVQMSLTYGVSADGSFVYAVAGGHLRPEDVLEYETAISADDRVKRGFKEIVDVSGITEASITADDFQKVRDMMRASGKRTRRNRLAIVVSRDSSFKNARYFEQLVDPELTVIVFNNIQTAMVWLGVTEKDLKEAAGGRK